MDRLACVDVPALPLQLLLRQRPDWAHEPVAVVEEEKPQGLVLWANESARRLGVSAGLSYAAGLSFAPRLRASAVAPAAIQGGVAAIVERLRRFTPAIEPAAEEPGVFWLDARGLARLHPSLVRWAEEIRASLLEAGFFAAVVVGFGRFGTYAAAKVLSGRSLVVFDEPAHETAAARRVPLSCIALLPKVRASLEKLGVRSVGDFLRLPAGGIRLRFGAAAHELHRLASGLHETPLEPEREEEVLEARFDFDLPESDLASIVHCIETLLEPFFEKLPRRGEALARVELRFELEGAAEVRESVRPAAPTLDREQILELVRLRLASVPFSRGVSAIVVDVEGSPADSEQLRLFALRSRRDPAAAARAFARLRATFGGDAVVRTVVRDGHLPAARFGFEPFDRLGPPRPETVPERSLVRRIRIDPAPLRAHAPHDRDGWQIQGFASGSVARLHGPYRLSGGWWRSEVERDDYFAELESGEILWIYYSVRRRAWFLQGEVA